jgi:TPR repeat protein
MIFYQDSAGFGKNEIEASRDFELAADRGYPDTETEYGMVLMLGRGFEKGETLAENYFKGSADQENKASELRYATYLRDGVAVPSDECQAAH